MKKFKVFSSDGCGSPCAVILRHYSDGALTGRTHRISVSDEQILSLSNQEYTKYMASAKKSTNAANTAMVQRVGKRLANAVELYLSRTDLKLM